MKRVVQVSACAAQAKRHGALRQRQQVPLLRRLSLFLLPLPANPSALSAAFTAPPATPPANPSAPSRVLASGPPGLPTPTRLSLGPAPHAPAVPGIPLGLGSASLAVAAANHSRGSAPFLAAVPTPPHGAAPSNPAAPAVSSGQATPAMAPGAGPLSVAAPHHNFGSAPFTAAFPNSSRGAAPSPLAALATPSDPAAPILASGAVFPLSAASRPLPGLAPIPAANSNPLFGVPSRTPGPCLTPSSYREALLAGPPALTRPAPPPFARGSAPGPVVHYAMAPPSSPAASGAFAPLQNPWAATAGAPPFTSRALPLSALTNATPPPLPKAVVAGQNERTRAGGAPPLGTGEATPGVPPPGGRTRGRERPSLPVTPDFPAVSNRRSPSPSSARSPADIFAADFLAQMAIPGASPARPFVGVVNTTPRDTIEADLAEPGDLSEGAFGAPLLSPVRLSPFDQPRDASDQTSAPAASQQLTNQPSGSTVTGPGVDLFPGWPSGAAPTASRTPFGALVTDRQPPSAFAPGGVTPLYSARAANERFEAFARMTQVPQNFLHAAQAASERFDAAARISRAPQNLFVSEISEAAARNRMTRDPQNLLNVEQRLPLPLAAPPATPAASASAQKFNLLYFEAYCSSFILSGVIFPARRSVKMRFLMIRAVDLVSYFNVVFRVITDWAM